MIGAAVAYALAREGRGVLLLDRAEPGMTGASFGNAGHIAAEYVSLYRPGISCSDSGANCLPSAARSTFRCDGCQSFCPGRCASLRRPGVAPRTRVTLRRSSNRPQGTWRAGLPKSVDRSCCGQMAIIKSGSDLAPTSWRPTRRSSWSAFKIQHRRRRTILQAIAQQSAESLEPKTNLRAIGDAHVAGLFFPAPGHVLDPIKVCAEFRLVPPFRGGASFKRTEVRAIEPLEERIALQTTYETLSVDALVVCTGAWAATLLEPLGLRVPMESARGYHVELAGHKALADAPILYANSRILLTPMEGRLRATSFVEFAGSHAAPDPRKLARLRARLRELGYGLSCRWLELGWTTTGASRLSSGHRSTRTYRCLLCGRAPTHWFDTGARRGGT